MTISLNHHHQGSRTLLWLQIAIAVVAAGLLAAIVTALVTSDGAADRTVTPLSVPGNHAHPRPGHPHPQGTDSWRLCFDSARSYHAWAKAQAGMPRCDVPGY